MTIVAVAVGAFNGGRLKRERLPRPLGGPGFEVEPGFFSLYLVDLVLFLVTFPLAEVVVSVLSCLTSPEFVSSESALIVMSFLESSLVKQSLQTSPFSRGRHRRDSVALHCTQTGFVFVMTQLKIMII